MTDPGVPENAEEPVGAVLARMRKAKRLTGAKLAAMVGMSQPKISRIERGQGLTEPADIGIIARALGADESFAQSLMDRSERSHDRMTDWRPASESLAGRQKTVSDWEATATELRVFETVLVPGPLQTSGYALAVFRGLRRVPLLGAEELTEAALLAAVSARVRRQEMLADQSKTFHFLLGEAALKRRSVAPVEMLTQINHLRELAGRGGRLTILGIADDVPADIPLLHSFSLFDDSLVVIDLYTTGIISRSRRVVESYQRVFDGLLESAAPIGPLLDKYEAYYLDLLHQARTPSAT
jgi:transcriptional regulator with XRE-family HTH domain